MSMRKIGMFMLILCTALLCCGSLFAATYYVDVDNGNNANDGLSQATAWKTIGNGEATNALSSGDTVKVLAGTYGPTALTSKSNGVTYLSEEGALIYAAEPNTTDNGFNLSGVSGATIKGFVFSGLHRGIYLENGSSDIRVTGNRFEDLHLQGGGEGCGVWVWSGSNVTIDHNIFKNVGTGPNEGCIVTGNAHNDVKVYNNVFDDVWFCIRNWGCPGTVAFKNNIIANVKSHAYHNSFDAWSCTRANNCYYNVPSLTDSNGFTDGGGELYNTDPLFVDTLYHIATYSPVIDKGTNVGYTYLGDAPDMGVYETEYAAPSGTVSGKVTSDGRNVSGVTVTVGDESAVTDAEGNYMITVEAGTYTASVVDSDRYTCTSGPVQVTVTATTSATANFNGTLSTMTFYVATDGSYDNPGTEDAPWSSIFDGDLKGVLIPGDTVIVKEGEYTTSGEMNQRQVRLIDCGGTADAPITYKAQGEVKIVNNDSQPTEGNFTCAIHVSAPYIVLDGFDFAGGSAVVGINHTTQGLVIKNCKIHDSTFKNNIMPMAAGIYMESGNSYTVENCEIYNIGLGANQGIESAAIYNMGSFWNETVGAQGVYHHNYIHNIGNGTSAGIGFWIRGGGTNDLVYNNTITDCTGSAVRTITGAHIHGSATAINNLIANCGISLSAEADTGSLTNSYNLIHNTGNGNVALGAETINANPLFTTAPDVEMTSPAVDSGTDLGYAYVGSAPDRGCRDIAYVAPTGAVSGTVTMDVAGTPKPVAGATVTVGTETAVTDANGNYTVIVDEGTYTASVADTGRFICTSGPVEVTVSATDGATANFTGTYEPATFYVATDGSYDNPGTEDAPWATIVDGDKKGALLPGDTVIVKEGEYHVTGAFNDRDVRLIDCNGTADAPITYKAQGDVKIINDFVNSGNPRNNLTVCIHVSANYLVIDGFDLSGAVAPLGTNYRAAGLVVKNCKMHDTDYVNHIFPQSAGIYLEADNGDATIENCEIYNIGTPYGAPGICCGIYTMAGFFGSNGPQETYHHNYIHNIAGNGSGIFVRGGGTNDLIYNNTITNASHGVYTDTGAEIHGTATAINNIIADCGNAFDYANANYSIVNHHNLISNTGQSIPYGAGTVFADPDFVTAPVISDVSPAVNKGTDVGLAYKGVAPDLGCYETDVQDYLSGDIYGTVTDRLTGQGVNGVVINIADGYTATTDAGGNYSVSVEPGTYTVSPAASEDYTFDGSAQTVTVAVGSGNDIDFVIEKNNYVWDAYEDFSTTNNPNGPWSYGWEAPRTGADGTALNLYTGSQAGGEGDIAWLNTAEGWDNHGYVGIRPVDGVHNEWGHWRIPYSIYLGSSFGEGWSTVRFTAPMDNTYTFEIKFQPSGSGATGATSYIDKNGKNLYTDALTGTIYGGQPEDANNTLHRTFTVQLKAGDTIDFVDNSYTAMASCSVLPIFRVTADKPVPASYTEVSSMDDLLNAEDGADVAATFDLVVTSDSGEFGEFVYAQTENRLRAIRLATGDLDLKAGDRVTVKGTVASDSEGKYVDLSYLDTVVTSGDEPKALGLTNTALTNDVLVRAWGEVKSVEGNTFVIFNGYMDFTCVANNADLPNVGDYVGVTGIATDNGVVTRDASDIAVYRATN